ncbi:hypothetical protein VTK73DRAFT_2688 [Phialemonium thermophilum]|uniref:Uncharacterized protein n=1 Tax=Phialemonium thermophilum TaxID=223376 RepID=A0ABR3VRH2_9PEZI
MDPSCLPPSCPVMGSGGQGPGQRYPQANGSVTLQRRRETIRWCLSVPNHSDRISSGGSLPPLQPTEASHRWASPSSALPSMFPPRVATPTPVWGGVALQGVAADPAGHAAASLRMDRLWLSCRRGPCTSRLGVSAPALASQPIPAPHPVYAAWADVPKLLLLHVRCAREPPA